MDRNHYNSEGELIAIEPLPGWSRFAGQHVLCIYDDPPPEGSGTRALTLLDKGTQAWLKQALELLAREEEAQR